MKTLTWAVVDLRHVEGWRSGGVGQNEDIATPNSAYPFFHQFKTLAAAMALWALIGYRSRATQSSARSLDAVWLLCKFGYLESTEVLLSGTKIPQVSGMVKEQSLWRRRVAHAR